MININNLQQISREELIQLHATLERIRENFEDRDILFKLNPEEFHIQAETLNPQQYGLINQKHFCFMNGYEMVSANEDKGDFKNNDGEFCEFKNSYINKFSRVISVKHIRLWQELDGGFYVLTINTEDRSNVIYKLYKLSKEQMIIECELNNANPCHMTKDNSSQNSKVELGFNIEVGSPAYMRWEEKYLRNGFDYKAICMKRLKQLAMYDERERMFMDIALRNTHVESMLVKEEESKEGSNIIETVFFCIENDIPLSREQSRTLSYMFSSNLIDRETFKKFYSIDDIYKHEQRLLDLFEMADKRKTRNGMINKSDLKGISAYILSEYQSEIRKRTTVRRPLPKDEDGYLIQNKKKYKLVSLGVFYHYKIAGFRKELTLFNHDKIEYGIDRRLYRKLGELNYKEAVKISKFRDLRAYAVKKSLQDNMEDKFKPNINISNPIY